MDTLTIATAPSTTEATATDLDSYLCSPNQRSSSTNPRGGDVEAAGKTTATKQVTAQSDSVSTGMNAVEQYPTVHKSDSNKGSAVASANSMTTESQGQGLGHGHKTSIDFAKLKFFGRLDERKQIVEAFQDVMQSSCLEDMPNSSGSTPMVMIWGQSGTGKSCLVRQCVDDLASGLPTSICASPALSSSVSPRRLGQKFYFIEGKHDECTGASDPFSAITQALKHLATQLRSEPFSEVQRLRTSVQQALGDDAKAITSMVPALSILVDESVGSSHHGNESASGILSTSSSSEPYDRAHQQRQSRQHGTAESSWNRLQYTFITFIKAIANQQRPLVLFLDDLQWASQVTIDLLSTLLLDPALKYFYLIGAVRQEANPHGDDPNDVIPLSHDAPVAILLDGFRKKERDIHRNIHLVNLTQHQMTTWVAEILNSSQDESAATNDNHICQGIQEVSQQLYKKTQGNAFFTIQLLEDLHRANVLFFNPQQSKWECKWPAPATFDEFNGHSSIVGASIGHEAHRFEMGVNIVDVIASRLRLLNPKIRTVLTLASYIRSNFDLEVLQAVVDCESQHPVYAKQNGLVFGDSGRGPSNHNESTSGGWHKDDKRKSVRSMSNRTPKLEALLEKAVLEGLLQNTIGDITYRFAHDRIKQAAQSLIPLTVSDEPGSLDGRTDRLGKARNGRRPSNHNGSNTNNRQKLKYRIGRTLWRYCQEKEKLGCLEDHGLLFVAADHLNSIPSSDYTFMTTMNLDVGRKALSLAAVRSASEYLDLANTAFAGHWKGRSGSDRMWEDDYDLTLALHQARIDAELALGNYDVGYKLCERLFDRARCVDHKLQSYHSMASAMGAEQRDVDAMKLSKQGARLSGVYPKRWFAVHAGVGLLALSRYFQTHPDNDLLGLPINTNAKMLQGMRFLSQVVTRSFKTKNILSMIIASTKIVRLSIRHGICADTTIGLAGLGMISAFRGEQQIAMRYVRLSRGVWTQFKDPSLYGWMNFFNVFFVEIWCCPIEHCLAQLKDAYTSALEAGEFEVAILCWFASLATSFIDNKEIAPLLKTGDDIINHKQLFKVDTLGRFPDMFVMMLKQFTGDLPLDWDEYEEFSNIDINTTERYAVIGGSWARMIIAAYFFKYDLVEKFSWMLAKVGPDEVYTMVTSSEFAGGIMAAGKYRQTKQKKYLTRLKQHRTELKRMAIRNGSNCLHRGLILEAEEMSVNCRKNNDEDRVKEAYDTAIALSLRTEHIHEAALCHELAGDYLLSTKRRVNETASVRYFTRAYELYSNWGGKAKLDHLESRRGKYIDKSIIAKNKEASPHQDKRTKQQDQRRRQAQDHPQQSAIVSLLPLQNAAVSLSNPSTFRRAQGTASSKPYSSVAGSRGSGSRLHSSSKTSQASPASLEDLAAAGAASSQEGLTDDDVSILTSDSYQDDDDHPEQG